MYVRANEKAQLHLPPLEIERVLSHEPLTALCSNGPLCKRWRSDLPAGQCFIHEISCYAFNNLNLQT